MQVTNVCPPKEILQSFSRGHLSPEEVERLAQHIERCEHCLAFLHQAAVQDAVEKAVKQNRDATSLRLVFYR